MKTTSDGKIVLTLTTGETVTTAKASAIMIVGGNKPNMEMNYLVEKVAREFDMKRSDAAKFVKHNLFHPGVFEVMAKSIRYELYGQ